MQEGPGMKTNRSKTAVKFGALEVVLCVREQEVTACYQIKNVAMVIFFFGLVNYIHLSIQYLPFSSRPFVWMMFVSYSR